MALRRRTWVILSIVAGVFAAFAILVAAARVPWSSETLRRRVEVGLAQKLNSQVELGSLSLRLAPELHIVGTGLIVRHKGRTDMPPLISIRKFTVRSSLVSLAHRHIGEVVVEGLDLEIPPNPEKTSAQDLRQMQEDEQAALARAQRAAATPPRPKGFVDQFTIDQLVADQARMVVIPRDPADSPKVWSMHQLRLHDVSTDRPMPFHSLIANGVPPGQIDTTGRFGPWDADEPGDTPIAGEFTLQHADLSVFNGISGMTSARGSYLGTLGTLRVTGDTDTPDFSIALAQHPIALKSKYTAVVDALNGDTMIEQVDASFLNTSLRARGGVYDVKGVKGRLLRVNVVMEKGRIEDVMRLAINTPAAPMVGALTLHTKLEIPPGDQDIVEKIKLNGSFEIRGGRFTDAGVQQKINELSRRASGKIKDEPADTRKVTSIFAGTFALEKGRLHVPRVTFDVPGALVDISGQYALRPQSLAFSGQLIMDAKVSQMTTGVKSLLLKIVDPLFRRDGRTVVPLKISGTRNDPSFGLDVKRVFSRGSD